MRLPDRATCCAASLPRAVGERRAKGGGCGAGQMRRSYAEKRLVAAVPLSLGRLGGPERLREALAAERKKVAGPVGAHDRRHWRNRFWGRPRRLISPPLKISGIRHTASFRSHPRLHNTPLPPPTPTMGSTPGGTTNHGRGFRAQAGPGAYALPSHLPAESVQTGEPGSGPRSKPAIRIRVMPSPGPLAGENMPSCVVKFLHGLVVQLGHFLAFGGQV
jgi:hypothetical protein